MITQSCLKLEAKTVHLSPEIPVNIDEFSELYRLVSSNTDHKIDFGEESLIQTAREYRHIFLYLQESEQIDAFYRLYL